MSGSTPGSWITAGGQPVRETQSQPDPGQSIEQHAGTLRGDGTLTLQAASLGNNGGSVSGVGGLTVTSSGAIARAAPC
ncbi:hypothetical protein [Pseudomonas sp. BIC9C]|uniref:hypothetical protein n=1 Tax=Pseudomonas sp. BIC9C TaxID=3078458 RepID=UPI002AD59176|nr:hypothetical protein [Pseudomonas sp. BIC9C]